MTHFNSCTARTFMAAGVKVFPCRESGSSAKAPYTVRGFKDATNDWIEIQPWFAKFPNAIWGLPCAMNGILVLDADRHGKADGVDNITSLFESKQFDCRRVPIVETPRCGYHFYFRRPEWLGRTKATLCDAVDVRDNAYVIAPGCTLSDGRSYKLVEGTSQQLATSIADRSLIDPPDWLVQMLLHPPVPPPREIFEPVEDEAALNKMKGIIRAALGAEEGQRNSILFWAACRLAEMARADPMMHEFAKALLEEVGARLGLSMRETRATVESGLRKAWEGDHDAR